MGGGGGDGLDVSNGGGGDDPELEAIKARCREMEEEALKLKQVIFDLCTFQESYKNHFLDAKSIRFIFPWDFFF